MGFEELLKSKLRSADEAMESVKSNSRIYFGGGTGFPLMLESALIKRADQLENVEVVHVASFAGGDYLDPAYSASFRHKALFIGPNARQAVNDGRADYVPVFLSQAPGLFTNGVLPLDIALIQVSSPDAHGFCSYGVEVGVTKPAAEAARLIIAEINPHMPRVLGDSFIHIKHIDGPVGVQSRNFSNERIYSTGWRAQNFLTDGIAATYPWIEQQVKAQNA